MVFRNNNNLIIIIIIMIIIIIVIIFIIFIKLLLFQMPNERIETDKICSTLKTNKFKTKF